MVASADLKMEMLLHFLTRNEESSSFKNLKFKCFVEKCLQADMIRS